MLRSKVFFVGVIVGVTPCILQHDARSDPKTLSLAFAVARGLGVALEEVFEPEESPD